MAIMSHLTRQGFKVSARGVCATPLTIKPLGMITTCKTYLRISIVEPVIKVSYGFFSALCLISRLGKQMNNHAHDLSQTDMYCGEKVQNATLAMKDLPPSMSDANAVVTAPLYSYGATIFKFCSQTCTVAECAKLCLEKEGCSYFKIGTGEIDGVDKTGT